MIFHRLIVGLNRRHLLSINGNLKNIVGNVIKFTQSEIHGAGKRYISVTSKFCSEKYVAIYSRKHKLKKKDGVPADYELVYVGPNVYLTSISAIAISSCVFLVAYGLIYYVFFEKDEEFLSQPVMITENEIFATSWKEFYGFCALFSVLALGIVIIARRYVTRIYRKDDNFTVVYAQMFPGLRSVKNIKAGEARGLPLKFGILPWSNSLFKVKGRKSIIIEDYFRTTHDLKVMLGGKYPFSYYDEDEEELN